ncbi:MAG TPA: hypothetical protein VGJ02_03585 [Pyrinomonadaceae bacterium]|jgi:hypothetical protein
MRLLIFAAFFALSFVVSAAAQTGGVTDPKTSATLPDKASLELANKVYSAHGGDKFRAMKTLVVRGSVDVNSPSLINQAIAGGFSMAFAGDKYRVELSTPVQSFKQAFDGQQTYTSAQIGFALPPLNRLGMPLLQRLGSDGYVVSKLPAGAKNKTGFRITAPDGFYTDFYIDDKTNQVKGFESQYDFNGHVFTTAVEIDKCRVVDGVVVPEKYSQRFDLGQLGVIYANFKSKDIMVNTELADDVFTSVK